MDCYSYQNDGKELWLETSEPQRNFENILYNKSYFTLIDQCARGRGTHMTKDGFVNHIIAGDRIIFVRDDDTGEFFTLNWAPVYKSYQSYKCCAGINYQIFENITNDMKFTWRIYVPLGDDPLEIWDIRVENLNKNTRNISLFSYLEMECDGTEIYCNFLFRSAKYYSGSNSIIVNQDAEFHELNDFPYHNGFLSADRKPESWDADKQEFIGAGSTIANPKAVKSGECSGSIASRDTPVTVMQFKMGIKAGSKEDTRLLVGACSDQNMIRQMREKYLEGNLDNDFVFDAMRNETAHTMQNITIDTPSDSMNKMLNTWVEASNSLRCFVVSMGH